MPATQARIAFLSLEWREALVEDTSVQTIHPLAPQAIEETRLITYAAALAEATRRQALRGVKSDHYEFTAEMNPSTIELDLGDVVTLTHPRFGLSSGGKFVIISVEPDAAARQITFGVWGKPA